MPLFVLTCIDKPNGLSTRAATREAHLAYLREAGMVRIAGPFLNEQGEPVGSMLIVEAEDLAAAREFGAADPYVAADLFQSVEVRPFRVTVGDL